MTALAATVGMGNIAGVSTAVALGGPGAIFWMWVTGLVGMATKYSDQFLDHRENVKIVGFDSPKEAVDYILEQINS